MTERTLLLVLNKHEDTLAYVDPDRLEVLAKVPAGHDPHELVIRGDRRFAYVSNYAPPGDTISVIDLPGHCLAGQIHTGACTRIHGAALAPDGGRAWFTATQAACLVEVDLEHARIVRTLPTCGEVSHMVVVSPDGKRLFAANLGTRNLSVLDRESGGLLAHVPCGRGGEGMAFTPDGRRLWVANQDEGTITVVDPARLTVLATLPCPGVPLRIRFTADGRLALVTSWEELGALVIMEVDGGRELKRLPLGNQPIGVEISPAGERAFVTNMTSDEVHVVDMARLEVCAVFSTGRGPDGMAWWTPP